MKLFYHQFHFIVLKVFDETVTVFNKNSNYEMRLININYIGKIGYSIVDTLLTDLNDIYCSTINLVYIVLSSHGKIKQDF